MEGIFDKLTLKEISAAEWISSNCFDEPDIKVLLGGEYTLVLAPSRFILNADTWVTLRQGKVIVEGATIVTGQEYYS